MRPPQLNGRRRARIAQLERKGRHARVLQGADDLIVRRQTRPGYPFRHHAHITENGRAILQRLTRRPGKAGRKADQGRQFHHARGMDHADCDDLLLRRKTGQVCLGADGGK